MASLSARSRPGVLNMPKYTVIDNQYMWCVQTALQHETHCRGCGAPYTTIRNACGRGGPIAVITDRSGSEQTHAHRNPECITEAVIQLELDEEY